MLTAKIVPFLRLPRGMDFFDYAIPEPLARAIKIGHRVLIPLRKKKVDGIVWQIDSNKHDGLKAIEDVFATPPLSHRQIRRCDWAAEFYGCSRSLILPLIAGPRMKRKRHEAPGSVPPHQPGLNLPGRITVNRWTDQVWRDTHIVTTAKAHLKQKRQLMILAPTISRSKEIAVLLQKTCKKNLCVFTSKLSRGAEVSAREKLLHGSNLIAVGTRILALAEMPLLKTICIDAAHREEHCQYDMNPRYDARTVSYWRSEHENIDLDIMSPCPRVEDTHAVKSSGGGYREHLSPLPLQMIVGLPNIWRTGKQGFISPPLERAARETLQAGRDVFFLANKKGYASQMICRDCGWIFGCSSCGMPLPGTKMKTITCRSCAAVHAVPVRCPKCACIRFFFPGIGIEKILEEAHALFPENTCIEFSSATVGSKSTSDYCAQKKTTGTLMIGTALVPTEYEPLFSRFGTVGIIAADSIQSHLNFRGQEEQWRLLRTMSVLAQTHKINCIVQSFSPDSPFMRLALSDDYRSFSEQTLSERKKFGWPPFSRCSVIYPRGTKGSLAEIISRIRECVPSSGKVTISILARGTSEERLLIRVPSFLLCEWSPLEKKILSLLPNEWLVDTDPIRL